MVVRGKAHGKDRIKLFLPSYALSRHASWLYSQIFASPPARRMNSTICHAVAPGSVARGRRTGRARAPAPRACGSRDGPDLPGNRAALSVWHWIRNCGTQEWRLRWTIRDCAKSANRALVSCTESQPPLRRKANLDTWDRLEPAFINACEPTEIKDLVAGHWGLR